MVKVIGSIVAMLLLVVAGYFVDPKFHSQIDGMMGKGKTVASETAKVDSPVEAKADGRLAKILDSGVLTVSVQNPSKPFFSNEGGRAKGFNVDFLNLVLQQGDFKGKHIVLKPSEVSTYAEVPQHLCDKNLDIAADGLTFNDDDLKCVKYTIPYVKDFGYSLIAAKGTIINSPSDISKLGILKGDPDARAFAEQAFPGVKLVELSDEAGADGKWIAGHIKRGTVDAVMYDYPFAVAEVEGTNLQFAMAKIKGSDIQYRIGVHTEDKDLLNALNAAIRKAVETDAYTEMLKTYFMSNNVAAVRRASSGEASYVVVKGDTLSTIAQAQLGDIKKYPEIQARNNLANPNFIAVGQKLVIPAK